MLQEEDVEHVCHLVKVDRPDLDVEKSKPKVKLGKVVEVGLNDSLER